MQNKREDDQIILDCQIDWYLTHTASGGMRPWCFRPKVILFGSLLLVPTIQIALLLFTLCGGEWKRCGKMGLQFEVSISDISGGLGLNLEAGGQTRTNGQAIGSSVANNTSSSIRLESKRVRHAMTAKPSITPWTQRAFIINAHLLVAIVVLPVINYQRVAHYGRCFVGNEDGFLSRNSTKSYWMETHGHRHHAMAVYCEFRGPVLDRATHGGLRVALDFREPSEFLTNAVIERDSRPVANTFNVTICLPSLFGSLRWKWIEEWLNFYRVRLRVDHFFAYSALPDLRDTPLSKGILGGDIDIIDVLTAVREYDMHYFGQSIAICDCLFLNNWLGTEWTIFQDYDEVLWLPNPWSSAMEFLSEYGASDGVVTFGSWIVDINVCKKLQNGTETFIERMAQLTSSPFCGQKCGDWKGRRKYAVRPRKVYAILTIHDVKVSRQRVNALNVSKGYLRHYRKVTNIKAPTCQQFLGSSSGKFQRHKKINGSYSSSSRGVNNTNRKGHSSLWRILISVSSFFSVL